MKSLNNNGVSTTTTPGQENYVTFIAGAFRGKEYFQYDYRHKDGELFSTVADSLEKCRAERDKWVQQKNRKRFFPSTLEKIENNKRLTKIDMGHQIGQIDPYHPASLYWDSLTRPQIVETFNKIFGTEIS